MKTNVYIDGFNLFYGALKGSPHKWLDLESLFVSLLPRNNVQRIRYFTARVEARDHDLDLPNRQEVYLRALALRSRVSVEFGSFMASAVRAPLVELNGGGKPLKQSGRPVLKRDDTGKLDMAYVYKSEEKGSDVNLAAHLLRDAFQGDCECAVIVSNDSDLLTPIRMAKADCGLTVGLVPPRAYGSLELKALADFTRKIRSHHLTAAQFPNTLSDAIGDFHKPEDW